MNKHCDIKYAKIVELLKTTKYEDIEIELLEKNIKEEFVDDEFN